MILAELFVMVALLCWGGYQVTWSYSSRSHLRAAHDALDRHEWREARTRLETCLHDRHDSPAVHLLAARAARHLELLDEAEEHLDTCLRLQGKETHAAKVERALLRVHRGELQGVEVFLRTCVAQNDPDTVEILDILSASLILDYRVAEAHRCLDEMLRLEPDNFHALVRHGWTAQSQTWYPQAVDSLQKALNLRPDADAVRLSLAEIQVALGRFADAQDHFEHLRERQPDNPSVLFGLARCLAGRGRNEQALQLLDRLLAGQPNDWKALGERGWLYVQLDRPAEAESDLRRAYSLAPPDLPLLIRLADCLRLLGKHNEARVYLEKADRLKADMHEAGQVGDLIREKSPNDPALRHKLACILLRLGKQQDALHWFQTALEKDPMYRPAHESLAALYEKIGAFEQAAYHRRFLIERPQ